MHISTEVSMDEYLFIALAKLKADRLRLQGKECRSEPSPEQLRLELREKGETRRQWFSQQSLWREQS
jgi:hypothetical protein